MKTKILFILLSFGCLSLCAQEMSPAAKQQNLEKLGENGYGGVIQTYDTRYEGVKGSPFFTEDWLRGNVELENGTSYKDVELRYNVYTDELIARNNKRKDPVIIDKGMVRSFTIGKNDNTNMENFIKVDYLEHKFKGVEDHQYVQELYKGEVSLYAINKKLLSKANFEGAYNTGKKYDEFTPLQANYYLITSDSKVHPFKSNKHSVLKAMSKQKKAVNNYIEEETLDLNECDDLVKLVMFYELQLNE